MPDPVHDHPVVYSVTSEVPSCGSPDHEEWEPIMLGAFEDLDVMTDVLIFREGTSREQGYREIFALITGADLEDIKVEFGSRQVPNMGDVPFVRGLRRWKS